ncbi:methyl-accepting chemotaxis protein [Paraburkholderia dinghuensis]|uniref:HAMP domain-containing protein n=1 Tax=Paraburkholderia dinghuensis TaxID=2305225 RepID=A0A3N6ND72_9BURK|nr:methyl-accepting chemotaxis protein [Paraburkholderia dinghuensis]RQH06427.1 HAMP domain-containing protein [Paraburkholderia dinghuensis]
MNLTIKARLILSMGLLSVLLLAGGLMGLWSTWNVNSSLQTVYEKRLAAIQRVDVMTKALNRLRYSIASSSLDTKPESVEAKLKSFQADLTLGNKAWADFVADIDPEEKSRADAFSQSFGKYFTVAIKPAMEAMEAHDVATVGELVRGPLESEYKPIQDGLDDLIAMENELTKGEYERAQANYQAVRIICILGVASGFALALGFGVWLIRAISTPLNTAVQVAQSVKDGNLTQKIDASAKDETGRVLGALSDMSSSLRHIVGEVRQSSEEIRNASSQIAQGNAELSTRTESQAASLEQTAASVEELSSTVRLNAENAIQADTLARNAAEVAVRGGQAVSRVVETMQDINRSANSISDIIGTIEGIAFQTNILALNAAVEAARAGEEGRGFAVVAGEVRSLAQRSANAAKEIKDLIDDSVTKVGAGTRLVDEAGSTMNEVVQSITRVADIMGEISSASQEQASGIDQISKAVTLMDEQVQSNAAMVEQASAAAQALRDQSNQLSQTVAVFKVA